MLTAAVSFKSKGRDYFRKQIANSGLLLDDDIDEFTNLYSTTIADFIATITNEKLKKFAGL